MKTREDVQDMEYVAASKEADYWHTMIRLAETRLKLAKLQLAQATKTAPSAEPDELTQAETEMLDLTALSAHTAARLGVEDESAKAAIAELAARAFALGARTAVQGMNRQSVS